MKRFSKLAPSPVFVAIDIAKLRHHVLIESAGGKRKALSIANTRADFDKLANELRALSFLGGQLKMYQAWAVENVPTRA